MTEKFRSVLEAQGKVSKTVFFAAAQSAHLPDDLSRVAHEVFVDGYRQSAVARHFDMPRQRVHAICLQFLASLNALRGTRKDQK